MNDIDFNKYKEYLKKRENPLIFDKKGKFVYFPVNKVMQTTIAREILKDRVIIKKDNPELWNYYFQKTDFNKVYKFGITRHPVKKFESAFNYLKYIEKKWSEKLKIKNQGINEFVKNRIKGCQNPYFINPHFEKQYEGFYCQEQILIDELFQMENEKHLDKLYQQLGVNEKRRTHRNKSRHLDLLDSESVQILESIYKNDIYPLKYQSMLLKK